MPQVIELHLANPGRDGAHLDGVPLESPYGGDGRERMQRVLDWLARQERAELKEVTGLEDQPVEVLFPAFPERGAPEVAALRMLDTHNLTARSWRFRRGDQDLTRWHEGDAKPEYTVLALGEHRRYSSKDDRVLAGRCTTVAFVDAHIEHNRQGVVGDDKDQSHGFDVLACRGITFERPSGRNLRSDLIRWMGTARPVMDGGVVVGEAGFWCEDIEAPDLVCEDSTRSALGFQGAVRNGIFAGGRSVDCTDQDIDFEPTGRRFGPRDLRFSGWVTEGAPKTYGMTLVGPGSEEWSLARGIQVIDCDFRNGGINIRKAVDCLLENVNARGLRPAEGRRPADPGLVINGLVRDVVWRGGLISSASGRAVRAEPHGTSSPVSMRFEGVTFRSRADLGLELTGFERVDLVRPRIEHFPDAGGEAEAAVRWEPRQPAATLRIERAEVSGYPVLVRAAPRSLEHTEGLDLDPIEVHGTAGIPEGTELVEVVGAGSAPVVVSEPPAGGGGDDGDDDDADDDEIAAARWWTEASEDELAGRLVQHVLELIDLGWDELTTAQRELITAAAGGR